MTNPGDTPVPPEELDALMEVRAGRRAPFSQLGDWVAMSGVDDHAKSLYWLLSMHVNIERDDCEVWPAQDVLGVWMGFRKVDSVTPYADQLVAIGAVDVEQRWYSNNMRTRNRYTVHQMPPQGYAGPVSLKDFYALRRSDAAALERWYDERRLWLVARTQVIKAQRVEAAKRAKKSKAAVQAVPRSSGVRTPLERGTENSALSGNIPAQPVPRSSGVRTPPERGSVPRSSGVGYPAGAGWNKTKSNNTKFNQTNLSLPQVPAAAGAVPVPVDEREIGPGRTTKDRAEAVAAAWTESTGRPKVRATERAIALQAHQLIADGADAAHLEQVARWMAGKRYTDLERAVTHRDAPVPQKAASSGSVCYVCMVSRPVAVLWQGKPHCAGCTRQCGGCLQPTPEPATDRGLCPGCRAQPQNA